LFWFFSNKETDEARSRNFQVLANLLRKFATFISMESAADTVEALADAAGEENSGLPLLADPKGMISAAYAERTGRSGRFALVLDANQRIIALPEGDDVLTAIQDVVAKIPPPAAPRLIGAGAPVLIVPGLLERAFCTRLIEAWRTGPPPPDWSTEPTETARATS